jgi:ATP-binding protein involved in chromosome partitioning
MADTHQLEAALRGVVDPELGADIVSLGMVQGIDLAEGRATVRLALTMAACPLRRQIEGDVVRKLQALPGVTTVEVAVVSMTPAQRAELMERARRRTRERAAATMVSPLTRVVAVGSGKGGVGKSSLSVNLAVALALAGRRVGLLDADIWGFSVPRLLGLGGSRLSAGPDGKILPIEAGGMQLVSTGLLLDDEDRALLWRGPMLSKALEQFLRDVAWDPALGYLILDLPPGTGDVQLSLARLLPQAELVVVTTPQRAAQRVAQRVADMARRSLLPVVGVIENMSGFTTEDGRHYDLFGRGGGQELADGLGVPLLGRVPIDPFIVEGGDEGRPVVSAHPEAPSARAIVATAERLVELLPSADVETCSARVAVLAEQFAARAGPADDGSRHPSTGS